MQWNFLDQIWQQVFQRAWDAYKQDSFPIGAVITDQAGRILAEGRNAVYDLAGSNTPISWHQLGHAEINALLQISKHDHPEITSYVLYTSLEPCIACFGCFTMSRVMNLKFAARDYFAGATAARDKHGYIENRGLTIQGPIIELEDFQMVLLGDYIYRCRPLDIPRILTKWNLQSPVAIGLGRYFSEFEALKKMADQNTPIEQVWNLVNNELRKRRDLLKT